MRIDLKLVFFIAVIWLAISSASILVLLSGASAEACAFWRLFISSIILALLGLFTGNFSYPKPKLHHVASGLMLAAHFVLWMRSLQLVEVYISTLLTTLYPLYALLIDIAVFRRGLTSIQKAGIILAAVLVVLYLGVHELVFNKGALLALTGGIACAFYFEIGSYARHELKEGVLSYAFSTYLLASLFVLAYSAIIGANIHSYPLTTYIYFVLMALVPMMFGHTLINYLLSKYPASLVTSISYGEPFGAGLLAYLVLGQGLPTSHIIFGVAIISVVLLSTSITQPSKS
ncbi:MAG: DMT family transporter [Desulfurococcaceae archaeon]|jgi:drug/metabolite transporter (DMT)-like permease